MTSAVTRSMAFDRTQEFFQLIQAEAAPVISGVSQQTLTSQRDNQFSKLAQDISSAFDVCRSDLDQLGQLAKQRTLFDDKSADVENLTYKIKQALTGLNANVDSLEGLCHAAPSAGSPGSQHAAAHRQAILTSLRTQLMDLTKEFKDILEMRSSNLKQLESRRGLYGQSLRPEASASTGNLQRRPNQSSLTSVHSDYDLESQTAQTQTLVSNTTYHHQRVEAVESIQRMVGELSGMFTRVAAMVGQQEEMVLRIDATVDDSLQRLREGQTHLLKYFNAIASQRSLIFKLLGMILAFSVFFIIFLA
eukprot:Blabericola_migrator_1__579@NODE_1142_length_5300_cov_104_746990_g777_i0_p3_GENE_NODE_1142_length_5300_cov_104_746990_g777_i0NODE_1142_length_5300_cov_104_746990_g777_i0_p3_ORF_typecomplete_len305_score51_05Syntaxin/PF00804_25/15Syntaxin/PF00804_25/3_5e10Filo_VP35/PF02097_15/4_2e09SNARE/PF05739_19/0_0044DUF1640/PF07798_11/0_094PspA_IM30/PF04012_12/0_13ATF7IP_BD/PF16788_5/0_036BLI1/PF17324_2/9e02BLI1/PF17324_2/0_86BLI1/PF17324_2/3_3e03BLI1/PF17324_2/2_1e02DUF3584/PF12128_8/0_049Syntaxin18_N/PF104